jgi:hypothetical protein
VQGVPAWILRSDAELQVTPYESAVT